jgi:hypothetical protein
LFPLKPIWRFGPQEFERTDHADYWAYVYVNINPYHIRGSAYLHIAMIFQVVYNGKFLNKLCFLLIPVLQPKLKFWTSWAWTNIISICTRLILIRRRNYIAGEIIRVLTYRVVDRGFEPQSSQINNYAIGIYCYSA